MSNDIFNYADMSRNKQGCIPTNRYRNFDNKIKYSANYPNLSLVRHSNFRQLRYAQCFLFEKKDIFNKKTNCAFLLTGLLTSLK